VFYIFQHGISFFFALGSDALVSHSLLHLLLILVVLWIYGRQRFQRDIEFMLGQPFASWKVFILRFIAPIILVLCLVCYGLLFLVVLYKLKCFIFWIAGRSRFDLHQPLLSSDHCDIIYTGVATNSGNTWLWILLPVPEHWHLLRSL